MSGITYLPLSSITNTGTSCSLSVREGAIALTAIPQAPINSSAFFSCICSFAQSPTDFSTNKTGETALFFLHASHLVNKCASVLSSFNRSAIRSESLFPFSVKLIILNLMTYPFKAAFQEHHCFFRGILLKSQQHTVLIFDNAGGQSHLPPKLTLFL